MPHHPRCGNVGTETLNPNETKKKKRRDKRRTKRRKRHPDVLERATKCRVVFKVKCALFELSALIGKSHKVVEHNNDDVNDAFITTILLRRNNNNGETTTT